MAGCDIEAIDTVVVAIADVADAAIDAEAVDTGASDVDAATIRTIDGVDIRTHTIDSVAIVMAAF